MSTQQQTILRVLTNNTEVAQYTVLDLYTSIPIKINKSYAELQDISKKNSDTALNITLPGSKKNNRFFENFFDVDTQSFTFSAIKKINCQVLINDEAYFIGYLKLNKINIQNSKVEYDISLYSTVGNLFGDIGNNLLRDLPFDDTEYTFNHTFNLSSVTDGWYTSNFSIDGEQPREWIYPVVHNGYLYTGSSVNVSGGTIDSQTRLYTSSPIKQGAYATAAAAYADGVRPWCINSPNEGLIDNQLKPALSIWNLIKLMFKTYGYTIKSDFMNTPWMKTLYMYGYFSANSTKFSYVLDNIFTYGPTDIAVSLFPSTGLTMFDLIVAQKSTGIPSYCSDEIKATMLIERKYHGFLGINFTEYYYETYTIPPSTSGVTITLNQDFPSNTIYRHIVGFVSASSGYVSIPPIAYNNLKFPPTPIGDFVNYKEGDYVNFSLVIDDKFKQIDFLSSIAKKFNLVFVENPDVPNQIIIEPYTYFVGTGNVWDWTDKLSYDQGFSVEPALNYVDSYLTFYDVEDGDYGNIQFKNRNNKVYGQKFIANQTDFKSTTGETKTTFSPEIFRQWDNIELPDGSIADSGHINLPLGINYAGATTSANIGGQDQTVYQYTGVKTKPKLMWFLQGSSVLNQYSTTGTTYNYTYSASTYTVCVGPTNVATGSTASGYTLKKNIPIMSNTMPIGISDQFKTSLGFENDNLSILFNAEPLTYIDVYTYNTYTNNDCYGNFYFNRIQNVLYNPNTRFLKGKFYLKLSDYKNLKANDLIKIKDQYFTWNKINGYNLSNTELTEVELVQANSKVNTYPTRYFKYTYCDQPDYSFVITTDFTNPNLLYSQYGWAIWYDNNSAIVTNNRNTQPTGFTSTVTYESSGYDYYVPFFIVEITKYEAENSDYYEIAGDQLMTHVYQQNLGAFGNNMPTYYVNSGNTLTGLNLFKDCTSYNSIATRVGIRTGTSTHYGPPIPMGRNIQTEAMQNIQTQNNKNIQTQ